MSLKDTCGKSCLYLILIFVAFYFFELSSFPLSVDEELAAFRTNPKIWIIQGRWGAFLLESYFLPQPIIPIVPPAIFGISCILSYILIIDLVRNRKGLNGVDYLNFAFFCAYPTWFFIAEFYSNLAGTGIALLSATFSVWLIFQTNSSRYRFLMYVAAAIAASFAIGIYQNFVFAMAGMVLGVVIIQLINQNIDAPWRNSLRGISVVGAGAVLYALLDKVFRIWAPGANPYFDGLFKLDNLINDPIEVVVLTFETVTGAYGLSAKDFGMPLWAASLIILLGFIVLLSHIRAAKTSEKVFLFLGGISILLAPFSLQLISGGLLPYRTFVGVPFAVWFFAHIALNCNQNWINKFSNVASWILVFQIFVLTNSYQALHYFTSRHDLLLAQSVSDRIFSSPEYDSSKFYSLAVYGRKRFEPSIYPKPRTSSIGLSFFGEGNSGRISFYMRLLGFPKLSGANRETETNTIKMLEEMPVFPAPGSVRIVDDVVLLRLGKGALWPNMLALERYKSENSE